jgi:hypothetical protein
MIRHRCAACGRAINRTDHFFEPSDGTLCAACLARLAPGRNVPRAEADVAAAWPPVWTMLQEFPLDRG